MQHIKLPIKGMHCRSCELLLEEKFKNINNVKDAKVSYAKGEADIFYNNTAPLNTELEKAVKDAGYSLGSKEKLNWISKSWSDYRELIWAGITLFVLYFIAKMFGVFNIAVDTSNVTYSFSFVLGLVAGISTCMAIVGGLILGFSARHAELHPEATSWQKFRPHLYFNLGRVFGYTLLGGLLGTLGSFIKISSLFQAILTLVIALVMIMLGIKLTGISPRLKGMSLALPSGIAKLFGLNNHQKEYSHRTAVITGALTFFLPCGFTQAMQLASVGSGSFVSGAIIMGLFALGTAPALLSIGGLTSVIKGKTARRFYSIVGLAVLLFGIFSASNALSLLGLKPVTAPKEKITNNQEIIDGYQIVRMTQKVNGYSPNSFTVKAGVPVRWIINSESVYSCASALIMRGMGISENLKQGENIIEFTPTKTGQLPFSCSMGMYRGVFNVVSDSTQNEPAPPKKTGWPNNLK